MKLALKHAPPRGLFKRLFHWLTAARLVTRYPHAGIVIDGDLLHTNLSRGVHVEAFIPQGWDLFDVPGGDADLVKIRLESVIGMPYDVFGLLAFVLPWRVSDSSRTNCYKLAWFLLTGVMPRSRVTAEDLLALIAKGAK